MTDIPTTSDGKPTLRRPTLPEPIEWRLWKNRQRRDAIVVSLSTYEDRNLVSVRTYTTSQDGKMLPTVKGVTLMIERLPELAKAINAALKQARELGLVAGDEGGK